jgi:hypothetical protein
MRFHAIQNVETALRFLRYKEIKLVNIRGEDIVDGNPKLTLGLIWTIILHFQVGESFLDSLYSPEMEFLNISLTKDSSLLLHPIQSPVYWRILTTTIIFPGFKKILTKKTAK